MREKHRFSIFDSFDSFFLHFPKVNLPANHTFFPAFFTKKTKKCTFFCFFFYFQLSFFKIRAMFTVRVFAIRQERSHINFGICCENEAALLKKAPPETTAALRIEREI